MLIIKSTKAACKNQLQFFNRFSVRFALVLIAVNEEHWDSIMF